MTVTNKPILTVGICTYNRRALVKEAIISLVEQSMEKTRYEIFLLDDGSTDGTKEMIAQLQKEHPTPVIRYFRTEGNSGLAHSRNLVVSMVSTRFVAFIDDDALADPRWLSNGLRSIEENGEKLYGVTGPVFPYYATQKPMWFKDEYVQDVKGKRARFLQKGETFSGPNMILRRDIILKFGGFNEQTDMKGDILALGEETTLFTRIWEQSTRSQLYYAPDVIVRHLTLPYKMHVGYLLKRWIASGQAYVAIHRQKDMPTRLFHAGKVIGYFGYSCIAALATFFLYPYWQQWAVERIGPFCFILGYVTRIAGMQFSVRHAART